METKTVTTLEGISAEAARALIAQATAAGLTLDEYLKKFLTLQQRAAAQGKTLEALLQELIEENENGAQTLTPYELVEDLIGAVDSSVPAPDADAQPRRTAFGAYLVEKHHREVKRSSALSDAAAQQGITPDEWVRRNFPNGRDSQGRLLSEALDTLIREEDSKPNGTH